MRFLAILMSLLMSLPVLAAWQLDNQASRLSFISVKKTNVAEVHRFTRLKGNLSSKAQASIIIDLSSITTGIEVRDQRIQKFLFETNLFPQAKFESYIDQKALNNVGLGESNIIEISGKLNFHGITQEIITEIMLARVSEHKVIVSSMAPIIIQANKFNFVKGVDKLKELAHLPSISQAVPVSFVFTFVN